LGSAGDWSWSFQQDEHSLVIPDQAGDAV